MEAAEATAAALCSQLAFWGDSALLLSGTPVESLAVCCLVTAFSVGSVSVFCSENSQLGLLSGCGLVGGFTGGLVRGLTGGLVGGLTPGLAGGAGGDFPGVPRDLLSVAAGVSSFSPFTWDLPSLLANLFPGTGLSNGLGRSDAAPDSPTEDGPPLLLFVSGATVSLDTCLNGLVEPTGGSWNCLAAAPGLVPAPLGEAWGGSGDGFSGLPPAPVLTFSGGRGGNFGLAAGLGLLGLLATGSGFPVVGPVLVDLASNRCFSSPRSILPTGPAILSRFANPGQARP